jgi:hypothetical protein
MKHRFTHYALLLLVLILAITMGACAGKTEPATQWYRTFGEGTTVYGNSVRQTTDGGYIMCGTTRKVTNEQLRETDSDIWLTKTDVEGNKVWDKTFNLSGRDARGESVQQTTDGGYIICGGVVTKEAGNSCIGLVKTDSDGNKLWDKTFAVNGQGDAWGESVQQTTDGGYVVCGMIFFDEPSFGAGVWLVKTDSDGNKVWDKIFGPDRGRDAWGNSVQQTADGGYIVCGSIFPIEKEVNIRMPDVWLIKTDAGGNKLWDKMFAASDGRGADGESVQQTMDGGYMVFGTILILSDKTSERDTWLVKTDSDGNKVWDKIFGHGRGYSGQQTTDGGYIICGETELHTGWLIKVDAEGNERWDKTFGEGFASGTSVQQTVDGGYIACGGYIILEDEYSIEDRGALLIKIAPEQ